ncbi:unnamed protein product [Cuscuta campestris]|uniref:Protein kinase domain-containing protein n=1 Tax=Cuscuta campestris TaxID=132261 RepID=A0A484K932_9ASTE|nr:unnamed protein product [Cuscuta campestris]
MVQSTENYSRSGRRRHGSYIVNWDSRIVYRIMSDHGGGDDPIIGRDSGGDLPVYKVAYSVLEENSGQRSFVADQFLALKIVRRSFLSEFTETISRNGNLPGYRMNLVWHKLPSGISRSAEEYDGLIGRECDRLGAYSVFHETSRDGRLLSADPALTLPPSFDQNVVPLVGHFSDRETGDLCLVMPFFQPGSLRSAMAARFPDGLPEACALVALRCVLKGLRFLHRANSLHRDINAGHIYIKPGPQIQLGFAATVYEHGRISAGERGCSSTSPKLPAAPEAHECYTEKSDIWLVGITALELAYGTVRPDREALEMTIRGITETKMLPAKMLMGGPVEITSREEDEVERSFSVEFGSFVAECLARDPEQRPSADAILNHSFFCKKGLKRSYLKSHFQEVVMGIKTIKPAVGLLPPAPNSCSSFPAAAAAGTPFSAVALDNLRCIFTVLPLEDRARAGMVCREWHAMAAEDGQLSAVSGRLRDPEGPTRRRYREMLREIRGDASLLASRMTAALETTLLGTCMDRWRHEIAEEFSGLLYPCLSRLAYRHRVYPSEAEESWTRSFLLGVSRGALYSRPMPPPHRKYPEMATSIMDSYWLPLTSSPTQAIRRDSGASGAAGRDYIGRNIVGRRHADTSGVTGLVGFATGGVVVVQCVFLTGASGATRGWTGRWGRADG